VELEQLRKQVTVLTKRLAAFEARLDSTPATAVSGPGNAPTASRTAQDDPVIKLQQLLSTALGLACEPMPSDPDEADTLFDQFAVLMHSERKGTPLLDHNLRHYTWMQLRKNVLIYLKDPNDADSFTVTRREPLKFGPREEKARFFLKASTRMPTPISFRKDVEDSDRWRIEVSSL
jgi:hypothetical protein